MVYNSFYMRAFLDLYILHAAADVHPCNHLSASDLCFY